MMATTAASALPAIESFGTMVAFAAAGHYRLAPWVLS
jgi:hypothetical protein